MVILSLVEGSHYDPSSVILAKKYKNTNIHKYTNTNTKKYNNTKIQKYKIQEIEYRIQIQKMYRLENTNTK